MKQEARSDSSPRIFLRSKRTSFVIGASVSSLKKLKSFSRVILYISVSGRNLDSSIDEHIHIRFYRFG